MITGITFAILLCAFIMRTTTLAKNITLSEVEKVFPVLEQEYQVFLERKNALASEKMYLEDMAVKIFTLYEMTKDVTKSLTEEEAFEVFKKHLMEHVRFKECHYFGPLEEVGADDEDHFVIVLKSKRRKIGYIQIVGMNKEDMEKALILGNQFALAMRRVRLFREIEQIAITDGLTELHTRRYALERLREEVERCKTRKIDLSFLMIDVDYFKLVNDKYGHITGDQVLREVGRIIRENIREIDVAGRYGGEEFCAILPDTGIDGAVFVAERIRQAAEKADIRAYDNVIKLTLSIGVATYPHDAKDEEGLIDKADWSLYKAKKQGRNRVATIN